MAYPWLFTVHVEDNVHIQPMLNTAPSPDSTGRWFPDFIAVDITQVTVLTTIRYPCERGTTDGRVRKLTFFCCRCSFWLLSLLVAEASLLLCQFQHFSHFALTFKSAYASITPNTRQANKYFSHLLEKLCSYNIRIRMA